ncbi:DUF948 domain-containing protein [Myxacorys almedinensis]|uniref:DUF948 domain-containing protein n=1 Tax=Myxacorys almedinensis TaxID=2651157 RepID=UPI001EE3D3ED|nr:DUF948 domain-containing protein [Myxacorys almedinensis]
MLVIDPIFWLGFSILLVAVSIAAVLVVAVPAFQELGRAARSAEKLFDTLNRELPPTLEAMRLTGLEISELTDDMSQGVQSAGQVVKQVDQSITGVKQQVQKAQVTSRSVLAGMKTAWRTFTQPARSRRNDVSDDRLTRLDSDRSASMVRDARRSAQLERYRDDVGQLYSEQNYDDRLDEPPDEDYLPVEQDVGNGNRRLAEGQELPPYSEDYHPVRRDSGY